MADIFTKEKRSEVMAKIRGKNTKIERLAFAALRKRGVYFRKHYAQAAGKPDIALPRKKRAVFIDGGFWHGYRFATFADRLQPFWREKIETNMLRDRRNRRKLKQAGWEVLRVWEHQVTKDFERTIERVVTFLTTA